jgi:hypothetical protein
MLTAHASTAISAAFLASARLHQLPARHGDGFALRIDDVAIGKYRQGPVKGAKKWPETPAYVV